MNAVDILKYGQQTVLQAIDGFPETAWETPGACGVWSVKDIIAHLASYERVLVDILTTFTRSGATPALNTFLELGGQFNDSEVNRRKERMIQDVLAELNDASTQVMSLIVTLPPETLRQSGTLPWYGMDYALYLWERVVQDLIERTQDVCFRDDLGEETRARSLVPGGVPPVEQTAGRFPPSTP